MDQVLDMKEGEMKQGMLTQQEAEKKQEMLWDYCPSCAGELDTGFECNQCGRDWRPWATLHLNTIESEAAQ